MLASAIMSGMRACPKGFLYVYAWQPSVSAISVRDSICFILYSDFIYFVRLFGCSCRRPGYVATVARLSYHRDELCHLFAKIQNIIMFRQVFGCVSHSAVWFFLCKIDIVQPGAGQVCTFLHRTIHFISYVFRPHFLVAGPENLPFQSSSMRAYLIRICVAYQ